MRRTRRLELFLLASVAASLGACGEKKDDGKVYRSMADCSAELDRDTCESQYLAAAQSHDQKAPRFENREACEAQFGPGACRQTEGHGVGAGWFVPAMVGFLAGRALSGPPTGYYMTTPAAAPGLDCRAQPTLPACSPQLVASNPGATSSSSGGSRSSGSSSFWRSSSSSSSSASSSSASSSATSRGGFGASASAHSSGGS